ncbi:MAG: 7-cyano-7-deazaguanine reductase [Candidatus Marinamargulisbacteria bacterium]|jgi:7-cyano-7-deazaguanine reductase
MAIAEGRVFTFDTEEAIKTDFLETFPYKGNRQHVTYETSEFSCVCPFSGLPDFGKLSIEYVPDKVCVELKSLKYYIVSYRNVGIYQEAATNTLFNHLYDCLRPHFLRITTVYNTRGGIDATCSVKKGEF